MKQKQLWLAVAFILAALVAANLGYRQVKKPQKEMVVSALGAETNVPGVALSRDSQEATMPVERASAEDVFAELKEAARKRDKDTLRRFREGWVGQCSSEELEALIALVDEESDSVWRGTMMEAIAGKWAQLDPEAAITFMTSRVMRDRRQNGLTRIFEVLARKDPAAAFALIETMGHPIIMQPSAEAVFKAWKKRDPAAAFAAVEMLERGDLRWSALNALCQVEHEGGGRKQLFESIGSIESSNLKRDAWKQAIGHWAEDAPFEEVVDWIGTQTFEGNLACRLEREAAVRHAADDPQAMAKLVSRTC